MTLLEWLQAGDSSFAIVAGVLSAPFFLWRWRDVALEFGIERDAQDRMALASHPKALAAKAPAALMWS